MVKILPCSPGAWYQFVNDKIIGTRLKDINVSYYSKREERNYILTLVSSIPTDQIVIIFKSCELVETDIEGETRLSRRVPHLDRELIVGYKIKKVLERVFYDKSIIIVEFNCENMHNGLPPDSSLVSKLYFHAPEEAEILEK